ncbi:MAG TPA: phosphoadenylyl-sulfate reductase [Ilumatobacter sp.]|jgi:phosphoadenosine phosphosulfate reductase|nr:phosphoadenylyl-sulfate reductase [Ilumatobacter sp.]
MTILLDPPGAAALQAATPVAFRRRKRLGAAEIAAADAMLRDATSQDIVAWAVDTFGARLVLTASFQDTTLIDIATRVDPDIEVVFLDTGFHFAETLNVVKRAMDRYALNLTVLRPEPDAADLWAAGTKACCDARKVAPLERYMVGHADAWLSGLRRADDPARSDAPIVSADKRGLVKVNPMAAMSDDEYDRYLADHDVLVNTLHLDGYASIGCWPCTEPATDGRAGRWAGRESKECGIHL